MIRKTVKKETCSHLIVFLTAKKKDCSCDLFGSLFFQPDLVNVPYTKHNRLISILFPHESKKL